MAKGYLLAPDFATTGAPVTPVWIKVTKTFTDFSTAGLTNDIEIFSLPAKAVIHDVITKHTAAFTGGSIVTYTASVGISGNYTKYCLALNILQAPGNGIFQLGVFVSPTVENFGTATSIRAQAISAGGNLNTATTGSVDFYLLVSNLE